MEAIVERVGRQGDSLEVLSEADEVVFVSGYWWNDEERQMTFEDKDE